LTKSKISELMVKTAISTLLLKKYLYVKNHIKASKLRSYQSSPAAVDLHT